MRVDDYTQQLSSLKVQEERAYADAENANKEMHNYRDDLSFLTKEQ